MSEIDFLKSQPSHTTTQQFSKRIIIYNAQGFMSESLSLSLSTSCVRERESFLVLYRVGGGGWEIDMLLWATPLKEFGINFSYKGIYIT